MKQVLKLFGGDKVIWILIVILTVYSVLAVSSSVAQLSLGEHSVAYHILKHILYLFVGWGIIYIVHLIPYRYYSIFAQLLVILAVILLIYTMEFGPVINNSSRVIKIGPINFQTSDFAKMALIMFVARYLSRHQMNIDDYKKSFVPVIIWIMLICGLIQAENLSTSGILFGVCITLLFIGRTKIKYIAILIGVGIVLGAAYFMIFKYSEDNKRTITWEKRIERFVKPDPRDMVNEGNEQANLAKAAISTGGLFGKFAGHSTHKHKLPQAFSDFIFAIIIEEYGFVFGGLPLVLIYMALLFRAGIIVKKCDRTFPAFLAIGLTLGIVAQALIHMGVAVGLFPVTGQTLPWISRGGSSIVFTAVAFGIIIGISRTLEESEEKKLRKETVDE